MASGAGKVTARGPAPSNVVLVAEALREAIVRGRLRAGERIKEMPLAEQLGVSRGPIRDAMRLLHEEGLIEILPNRGAVVPEVHADGVLEVYALRASLGSLALHKLLLDADSAAVARIVAAARRVERAVQARREQRAADADLAFQDTIVRGSGLPLDAREFERLSWQVRMFIATLDMHYADKFSIMLEENAGLVAAIERREIRSAERVWREKFERWVRDFIERLPEEFDAATWVALTAADGTPGARRS